MFELYVLATTKGISGLGRKGKNYHAVVSKAHYHLSVQSKLLGDV